MADINFAQLTLLVSKSKWNADDLATIETALTENRDYCSKTLKDNFCTECYAWTAKMKCEGCGEVSAKLLNLAYFCTLSFVFPVETISRMWLCAGTQAGSCGTISSEVTITNG